MENQHLNQLQSEQAEQAARFTALASSVDELTARRERTEQDVEEAAERLRASKRAAISGAAEQLPEGERNRLTRILLDGPIDIAAYDDVIAETSRQIEQLGRDRSDLDTRICHARLDGLEVSVIECRLEHIDLDKQRQGLEIRERGLLEQWVKIEADLRSLGDEKRRPFNPLDYPDGISHDANGRERSADERDEHLQSRLRELKKRLAGRR